MGMIIAWIRQPTWVKSRAYLEAHPTLFRNEADEAFAELIRVSGALGEKHDAEMLAIHRRLLAQVNDAGFGAAYDPLELSELLTQLNEPADSPEDRRRKIEMLERALRLVPRAKLPVLCAQLEGDLGFMLAQSYDGDRRANLESAITHLREALQGFHQEANPAEWMQTQYNLALALFDLSESLTGTEQLAAQVEAITCDKAARDVEPGLIRQVKHQRITQKVGMHFFAERMWPDAVRYLTIALDAFDEIFPTYLRGQDREWELGEITDLPAALAYALVRGDGEYAAQDAVFALEHGRARLAGNAMLLQQELQLVAAAPHLPPGRYARFREASYEHFMVSQLGGPAPNTAASANRLTPEESKLRSDAIIGDLQADGQEAMRAREKYNQVIAEIREVLPDFEYDRAMPPARIFSIARDWLKSGESLAYLAHTPAGAVAVLVSADIIGISALGWTDEQLTTELLRELLVNNHGSGSGQQAQEVTGGLLAAQYGVGSLAGAIGAATAALGSQDGVIAQLAAAGRDAGLRELVLIPGGLLGLLPVHAAMVPAPDGDGRRQPLLDLGPVSYAPSALVWAACRRQARQDSSLPVSALVVGNPIPLPPHVPPLPGAAAEAQLVVQTGARVAGSQVTALESEAATRAAVLTALKLTERSLTHAHFACHAQADLAAPQLSGVLLADGQQLAGRDLLLPGGIRFEHLRLCVLSACQTAIVGADLPDEVTSLSAGWLQAGAAGVLASLWPVSDRVTLALMGKFYELHWLDQLQPGDALWLAQRWLRGLPAWRQDMEEAGAVHGAGGPEAADAVRDIAYPQAVSQPPAGQAHITPFDSPVYWAAFTLNGS
jgi:hypothetical protein